MGGCERVRSAEDLRIGHGRGQFDALLTRNAMDFTGLDRVLEVIGI